MHGGQYRHHPEPSAPPWGCLAAVAAAVVLLALLGLMAAVPPDVAPLERRLPLPTATGLSAPATPSCRVAATA